MYTILSSACFIEFTYFNIEAIKEKPKRGVLSSFDRQYSANPAAAYMYS